MTSLTDLIADYTTPTLKLGVTGLSRAGKTVFITGLVRTLTEGGGVPAVLGRSEVPGFKCYLEPQPDDDIPRFAYEEHLASLAATPPRWPESTRRVSQLRLTFEWDARDFARRALGVPERLFVDLIDYPGEWLIDLAMLEQSFDAWSLEAIDAARSPARLPAAKPFLEFLSALDPRHAADEQTAIRGARLFTDYLVRARQIADGPNVLGPGRFLMPGDLEGSPLLTFFPFAFDDQPAGADAGGLVAMLDRRFRSYKSAVVEPFFADHFSKLDRQIVLVDALGALNGGAETLRDLEHAMGGVLAAFRPGRSSLLGRLMGWRRVDRIVFAASKADFLNSANHAGLEAVLRAAVSRAERRAEDAGAAIAVTALAGLRATEDVVTQKGADRFQCIRGVPAAGETIAGKAFDGRKAGVVFPGDLPADPLDAFAVDHTTGPRHRFVRFEPPRVSSRDTLGQSGPWPHIGLDRIAEFLIGDRLP